MRALGFFCSLLIFSIGQTSPLASRPGFSISSRKADLRAQEIEAARLAQWADELTGFASCKYASDIPMAPPLRKVALTFDDGPDSQSHAFLLDVLKRHNIHATFFFVGKEAAANPHLVADVKPAGHLVASHSWDHANFHKLSTVKQAKEVIDAERPLKPYLSPKLFRYPYGNSSCATNKFLKGRGYKYVGWHIDSCDWAFNKTGSVSASNAKICGVKASNMNDYTGHVIDTIREEGGGIILMHEVQPNTVRLLEPILTQLKKDGFQFINLDDPAIKSSLW